MPTLFRERGYRFLFYIEEGNEPCHVHVIGHGREAKFWIPSCELVRSYNLKKQQIRAIRGIVQIKKGFIKDQWNAYFRR